MIKKPTVLVLGAGSNVEYDFPTGSELVSQLRKRVEQPDKFIQYFRGTEWEITDNVIRRIEAGLRRTGTIDQLVESHPNSRPMLKVMIAEVISSCEKTSKAKIDQGWYSTLLNKMWCPNLKDFHGNDITIVTFNYDRSLEYAMYSYLMKMYEGATAEECVRQMQGKVIHVYGDIGCLHPFERGNETPLRYGEFDFYHVAKAIKTVHDEEAPNFEGVKSASKALLSAKIIGFLGFGYDKKNLTRIIDKRYVTPKARISKSKTFARIQSETGTETILKASLQGRLNELEPVEFYGTAFEPVDPDNIRHVKSHLPGIILENCKVDEMLTRHPVLQTT